MPQQQKDIFDQALEDLKPPVAAPPTPPPTRGLEQSFPGVAQMAHQASQMPKGLMQMAGSVSPLRFREGWDQPTLEVPEALKAIQHPLDALASAWEGMIRQPIGTVAQEAGALVAPNMFQAPPQSEMDQATRGATQFGASLIAPAAMKEGGEAVQGAATKAGIPQRLAKAGTVADDAGNIPKWANHPAKVMAGPVLRQAGRALYDVTKDPKAQMTKVGEYVPPPGSPPTPTPDAIDVPYRPPAEAPASPPKQVGAYQQPKLAEAPTGPKQLGEVKPGTQIFKGQEGGMGSQPHADVVAQRPMIVRTAAGDGSGGVPGRMRLETVNEMKARLSNFGRGVTKQPTAEAEPLRLPKPTPPKKGK